MSFTRFARHVVPSLAFTATFLSYLLGFPDVLLAAEAASEEAIAAHAAGKSPMVIGCWVASLLGSLIALFFARRFFMWMVMQDEGDDEMVRIAEHVRQGADAYLKQQYRLVAIFFMVTSILLAAVAFIFQRAIRLGAVRIRYRRLLFRSRWLVRDEDRDARQFTNCGCCQKLVEPGPAGCFPKRCRDGAGGRWARPA